ncbi:zinc-binding oxidoreductase CipB [Polyplosphaeria fusca]|uniref:Zinc-binding oxidoreductase CipB n=1 Tax=Polyplosphaeria fusca TaxID=682080 RepID=A0A9P4RCR5_9PLEO|nr:zinc-binding oxidoreductase CipB [Polyplosphaeria fusca]
MGDLLLEWIKYPFILGSDVSGEVVEIGSGISRFKVGDRVLGHAVGPDKRSNRAREGGFQEYVVLRENLMSAIPDSLSYEKACVLPLAVSTAASGMFMKDYLGLQHPTPKTKKDSTGEVLLVWGGSTSVGSGAIQLAVGAGYQVITTASPKNFDYVESLGASQAFDYRGPTAIADITTALKGKKCAGAIAIGEGSLEACIPIISASQGRKFIAQASLPAPPGGPPQGLGFMAFVAKFLWFNVSTTVQCWIRGVGKKFIWGSDLMANEVGAAIYENYLPEALAAGLFVAAPKPRIVGHGLEHVQDALDTIVKGVSAEKLVVTI